MTLPVDKILGYLSSSGERSGIDVGSGLTLTAANVLSASIVFGCLHRIATVSQNVSADDTCLARNLCINDGVEIDIADTGELMMI